MIFVNFSPDTYEEKYILERKGTTLSNSQK